MKITKFGHACLLIEEGEKKLLIDPGSFTFNPSFTPRQVGPVDVIVITHNHGDHMSPDAIKQFLSMQQVQVIGAGEIANDLEKEGISAITIVPGSAQEVQGFTLESFVAKHEEIPGEVPENHAYLINGSILHMGDSYATEGLPKEPKILALPTQAPWSRLVACLEFAKALRPKNAIPIHNYIYKDEIGKMFDKRIQDWLKPEGIEVQLLDVGESWELN